MLFDITCYFYVMEHAIVVPLHVSDKHVFNKGIGWVCVYAGTQSLISSSCCVIFFSESVPRNSGMMAKDN